MSDINYLFKLSSQYESFCHQDLAKFAKIKKMPNDKYRVLSEKDKNLGTFDTKSEAEKRLRQVEFFKHRDKNKAEDKVIDLTKSLDFSFSAIMRELRQHASKTQVRAFLVLFKKEFDQAIKKKLQKPDKVALQNSLIKFNKKNKIKVNKKLVKNAAVSELGKASLVGKYLSDIVRFTINRIPVEKRNKALFSLRNKFNSLNVNEISQKNLPPTSAIGQSITFVKHVLFNHDPQYIKEVIKNLIKNL